MHIALRDVSAEREGKREWDEYKKKKGQEGEGGGEIRQGEGEWVGGRGRERIRKKESVKRSHSFQHSKYSYILPS